MKGTTKRGPICGKPARTKGRPEPSQYKNNFGGGEGECGYSQQYDFWRPGRTVPKLHLQPAGRLQLLSVHHRNVIGLKVHFVSDARFLWLVFSW